MREEEAGMKTVLRWAGFLGIGAVVVIVSNLGAPEPSAKPEPSAEYVECLAAGYGESQSALASEDPWLFVAVIHRVCDHLKH
jgi:hypothetical protein